MVGLFEVVKKWVKELEERVVTRLPFFDVHCVVVQMQETQDERETVTFEDLQSSSV